MSYSESASKTESDNKCFVKNNFSWKISLWGTTDETYTEISSEGVGVIFWWKIILNKIHVVRLNFWCWFRIWHGFCWKWNFSWSSNRIWAYFFAVIDQGGNDTPGLLYSDTPVVLQYSGLYFELYSYTLDLLCCFRNIHQIKSLLSAIMYINTMFQIMNFTSGHGVCFGVSEYHRSTGVGEYQITDRVQ